MNKEVSEDLEKYEDDKRYKDICSKEDPWTFDELQFYLEYRNKLEENK